jgi:hypothetical protein
LFTQGLAVPDSVSSISSSITFLFMLAAVGYSVVLSAAGLEPNRLPLISDRVKRRVRRNLPSYTIRQSPFHRCPPQKNSSKCSM